MKVSFTFFVNFKTYSQGSGKKALELACSLEKVSKKFGWPVVLLIQPFDFYLLRQEVSLPLWLQHLDSWPAGAHTGAISLETALGAEAKGALLNHSERPLPPGTIKQTVSLVRKQSLSDFSLMVAVKTRGRAERLVKIKPDYLAYEPKELIGTRISVSQARSKTIKKIVLLGRRYQVPVVVGAGIHSGKDVLLAKKMGASGVLVSSAIVLASSPEKKLAELMSLIKKVKK